MTIRLTMDLRGVQMIPKFRVWFNSEMYYKTVVYDGEFYLDWREFIDGNTYNDAVLMQSAGLLDKNGKEIFEGDVVKCYTVTEEAESEYVGVVCFEDFSFVIVDEKDTYDPLWNYKSGFVTQETEIEIIGDIYRNPELLEGME